MSSGPAPAQIQAALRALGIADFNLANPSDGEVPVYDALTGTWVPGASVGVVSLPLSLANGGTALVFADPNADRIMFWDDSAGHMDWLTLGTNLTITGTTLNAAGGGGGSPALPFGSLQFNDSGSFGGFGSWDGTGMVFDALSFLQFGSDGSTGSIRLPAIDDSSGNPVSGNADFGVFGTELYNWGGDIALIRLTLSGTGLPQITLGDTSFGRVDFNLNDAKAVIPSPGISLGADGSHFDQLFVDNIPIITSNSGTGLFTANGGQLAFNATFETAALSGQINYFPGASPSTAIIFYGFEMAGYPNLYYEWFDSRGVRRVREDTTFDSVGQAIEALYNPQYAKYIPGAQFFERGILGQFNGNVFEVGTERGSAKTLTSLTSNTTTATATLVGMNPPDGAVVTIAGATGDSTPYNGTYTITRIDNDSFSYTFAGSTDATAVGTITARGGTLRSMKLLGASVTTDAFLSPSLTVSGLTTPTNKPVCFDSAGKLYAGSNTMGVLTCP